MIGSFELIFFAPLSQYAECMVAADFSLKEMRGCVMANGFTLSFSLMLFWVFFTFFASRLTGNDSWVDRSWSIIPIFFAWIFACYKPEKSASVAIVDEIKKKIERDIPFLTSQSDFPKGSWLAFFDDVPVLFACCITLWGIRLTYNFYRRGGYTMGGEDYRWEVLRKWPVFRFKPMWYLFSFGFISFYQLALIWLITVPLWLIPHKTIMLIDICTAGLFLAMLVIETIADQQQWNFQNEKRNLKPQRKHLKEDYANGFLTHGLFGLSRHPNVWAEQQMWVVVFGASFVYSGGLNASFIGALLLVLLTYSSCLMTEGLSIEKYPCYNAYKKVVPILVPMPSFFSRKQSVKEAIDEWKEKTTKKTK